MSSPNNTWTQLKSFFEAARARKQSQFDRTLPFGEYVVDRWEKARQLNFGEGSSIYDSAIVLGQPIIGCNVWVGPNVLLDATGGLEIGDGCTISAGVQIYSHDSVARCLTGGEAELSKASVKIRSRSYIGPNSIISKGVQIGNGCVIGAASFVNMEIPDGWVAHGTPAKLVRPVALQDFL